MAHPKTDDGQNDAGLVFAEPLFGGRVLAVVLGRMVEPATIQTYRGSCASRLRVCPGHVAFDRSLPWTYMIERIDSPHLFSGLRARGGEHDAHAIQR